MFTKEHDKRIRILFLILCFILVLVVVKVFYTQVFSYKKLSNLSDDLWSRTLPITAVRGKILDRNGLVLADSITTTGVVVVPNQISDKEKVARDLSSVLDVSYEKVLEDISKSSSLVRLHPYGRKLNNDKASIISSFNDSGVYLVKESSRYYPYDNLLSHVLGYVGVDNQGLSGLELQYDSYLTGSDGYIKYYSDAKGNNLNLGEYYKDATSGMDIMLSIDLNIQMSIERELSNIEDMFNPDHALAIAMNPNTGEIYAMASRPSFNPNDYKAYSNEVINRNLPIWMTYEPGSTFNVVTF